jgi:protein-S-isoprenylcysteine O-methyltransferase Ste14
MSLYRQWSRTEHRERTRIGVTLLAGPVFVGLIPCIVARLGPQLDRRLGLAPLRVGALGRMLGGLLTAVGFSLGFWSVATQLDRGRGTPLPVMPTQELLTEGPFRCSRNPMTLGTILAYLGIAVTSRTMAGSVIVLAFAGALLTYLKRLEEPELAERFGEAYLAYRRSTPFIVPRVWR